jgi:hypothetical protein
MFSYKAPFHPWQAQGLLFVFITEPISKYREPRYRSIRVGPRSKGEDVLVGYFEPETTPASLESTIAPWVSAIFPSRFVTTSLM